MIGAHGLPLAVAKRSLCDRRQVGAVIVSADNRVQAAGYNGPRPGYQHEEMGCRKEALSNEGDLSVVISIGKP